jgi:adenylate kinase
MSLISTGDLLRTEAESQTELGRELARRLAHGDLIDDELVNRMVESKLALLKNGSGVILDGYPRTVQQAQYLEEALVKHGLSAPLAIHLDVPAEVIVQRLSSRRQCPGCGRVYNLKEQAPKQAGICDGCGRELIARNDDEAEVIRRRLATYREQTGPVLAHYRGASYHLVEANRTPEEVFGELRAIVESTRVGQRG